jgi:uncharacterized protein (DUF4415 family)
MAKSRTDWARLKTRTQAEIDAAALADPDNPPLTDEQLASLVVVMPPPKQPINIRLDEDIISWFKAQGSGYQTRINQVLRAYVDARQRKRAGG